MLGLSLSWAWQAESSQAGLEPERPSAAPRASLACQSERPTWKDLHRFERVKSGPEPPEAEINRGSPLLLLLSLARWLLAPAYSLSQTHSHTHSCIETLENSFIFQGVSAFQILCLANTHHLT